MTYSFHERVLDTSPWHMCVTLKQLVDTHGQINLVMHSKSGVSLPAIMTKEKFYNSIFFHKYILCIAT